MSARRKLILVTNDEHGKMQIKDSTRNFIDVIPKN